MPWPILDRPDIEGAVERELTSRRPRAVLLRGPSGIGKTTAAQRVAERATARDLTPLAIVGLTELREAPLAPFLPVLPAIGVRYRAPTGLTTRDLIAALGARADSLLLLVDDAPLLDDASAAVIHQLVRAFAVPTIMTARTEHGLAGPLERLAVEGALQLLDVAGLTRTQTDDLLRRRFGTTARPDDVSRLHHQTAGNPLHLREIIALAERHGLIRQVDAGVEIDPVDLPRGVRSSITDRLAELDGDALAVLRLVAFGASAPRSVLLLPQEERLVGELLDRGLVDLRPGDVLRVSHPSVGEVATDTLGTAEREQVLATVAARLESNGNDDLRFTAVRLRCDTEAGAGQAELAWAVRRAFAMGEHAIAHDLAERLHLCHPGRPRSFGVLVDHASALSALGRLDEADTAFRTASATATASADHALLVSRWGTHLAYRRFDVAAALSLAERTVSELTDQDRRLLDPEIRTWRMLTGEIAAVPTGRLDQQAADADPEVTVRGAISAVMLDSMGGRVTGEAAQVLTRIEDEHGILDPFAAAMVHLQQYFLLLSSGEGDAAARICEEQRVVCTPDAAGMWSLTLGLHRMYGGRLVEARSLTDLAVEQLRWRDPLGFLGFALALRANVEAQHGDVTTANGLLDDLLPAQLRDPKTAMQVTEAHAYLTARGGDPSAAAQLVIDACRGAIEAGHDLVAAITLAVCLRIGRPGDAAPLLQEILDRVGHGLALYVALRDAAVALVRREPKQVRDAAGRLAAAGMQAAAVDALRYAERWPAVRQATVELLAVRDQRRRLEQSSDPSGRDDVLTGREREVVELVRQRLSSREIADRLVLSVRTVDNHLTRIYRKLGVSGRSELRALLDSSTA
ncbi:LuxR C-terminal-related transcriptional regulator [Nocardioides humi]|uniref:LuxR C-terminal-related transcriptional regulator n=2 Tax=Nocardioides humi TaxID=449461 RepID=A0ABN2AJR0_9ACTN